MKEENPNQELEKYRIEKPLHRILTHKDIDNQKTPDMKTVNSAMHYQAFKLDVDTQDRVVKVGNQEFKEQAMISFNGLKTFCKDTEYIKLPNLLNL